MRSPTVNVVVVHRHAFFFKKLVNGLQNWSTVMREKR